MLLYHFFERVKVGPLDACLFLSFLEQDVGGKGRYLHHHVEKVFQIFFVDVLGKKGEIMAEIDLRVSEKYNGFTNA